MEEKSRGKRDWIGRIVKYKGRTEVLGEVVSERCGYIIVRINATKTRAEHLLPVREFEIDEVKM